MHIFLTGPKQVGKSTIIQKVIERLKMKDLCIGGFCTYQGISNDLDIYINYYDRGKPYTLENKVAYRTIEGATPLPHTFDSLGVKILSDTNVDIIVMDELGFLESSAELFKSKVLTLIDGIIPILGVIKEQYVPWLEQIKYHPKVETISVTQNNRDFLPELVLHKISTYLSVKI